MKNPSDLPAPLSQAIGPDETIRAVARSTESTIAVSDRRFLVANESWLALDIPIDAVRRVQFDIEKRRPATLVIVPDDPNDEPQVLAIPADQLAATAAALTLVGQRLAELGDR